MIIWHRVNSVEDLENIPEDDGVEIDVRSIKGIPYLSHFIEKDGVLFDEWIKHYHLKGTLVLNVKEEGLESILIEILNKYHVYNYVFLDEPFWYLLCASRKFNNKNFAIRVSKFESVETALKARELSDWVWYDYFDDYVNPDDLKTLINAGFKVIMPSPELVGSNAGYDDILHSNKIKLWAICKDKI